MNSLNHGSLFSGIGGFDLASEWMGWENIFHCEWNAFGKQILTHYWPNSISYDDITKTDFTIHRGRIDILTGGFPCQPYSVAGKRKGTEDERHLWPEMLRAIREIQPIYVVGENVGGIVSWNSGLVFHEVQTDLEAQGYEVQPFILPACAKNAPHRRDRVWFIAYNDEYSNRKRLKKHNTADFSNKSKFNSRQYINKSNNFANAKNCGCRGRENKECSNGKREVLQGKCERCEMGNKIEGCSREWDATNSESRRSGVLRNESETARTPESNQSSGSVCGICNATNSNCQRCNHGGNNREKRHLQANIGVAKENKPERNGQKRRISKVSKTTANAVEFRLRRQSYGIRKPRQPNQTRSIDDWSSFPTQSPICGRDDGISTELDGITFSKWRNESIKGYGNAIVPQIALEIFKVIEKLKSI